MPLTVAPPLRVLIGLRLLWSENLLIRSQGTIIATRSASTTRRPILFNAPYTKTRMQSAVVKFLVIIIIRYRIA